jgi:hypothetical protein
MVSIFRVILLDFITLIIFIESTNYVSPHCIVSLSVVAHCSFYSKHFHVTCIDEVKVYKGK